jgi:transglutaminase-like putative cysteine protease
MTFDGRYLWVADRLADRLYAVVPDSGEVVLALPSTGPHPSGLAWTGRELVAVDYQTDRLSWIKRDDTEFLARTDPREEWVVFTHQVRNFGPDTLPNLESLIAFPSDLESQQLLAPPIFDPKPQETIADQYGQQVARFPFKDLAAGQTAEVRMKVRMIARAVQWRIYPENVQSLWQIPAEIKKSYLTDSLKYDLKNPIIAKAAAEASGQERNPYWIARRIYRYVQDRLHYERIGGWDVAPKVLERGSGSCSEYSYVYIAICRAAGLPARYAGSLVIRKDQASYDDVYHRWVEVYLPPYGWVPVDPSRGDKLGEAERADSFGSLSHDFLITTRGGGGSSLLDWSYNYNTRFACRGRCRVEEESLADWSPEDPDAPSPSVPLGQGASKPTPGSDPPGCAPADPLLVP